MKALGLFEKIFKKPNTSAAADTSGYFELLNGYAPVFSSSPGSLYEMEITRAAIHRYATFCSKLKPELLGTDCLWLKSVLEKRPNPYMDTCKFLYRIATILAVNNTAFIVPIEAADGSIEGYYPILPTYSEIREINGKAYLRYTFANGKTAAIEFERVGIMTKYQYKDDIFGESQAAMKPTLEMINAQNNGIINAAKNSASIRFVGKLAQMLKDEDVEKERQKFTLTNLSGNNQTGLLLFDRKYEDVKQIISRPYTVDSAQIEKINENVYRYFGTNANILENKYTEDEWAAYYEGEIEPFALQLSLVLTNMTFTRQQIERGSEIMLTANRLQYASNKTKLEISTQMFDRGILSTNDVMDIWNMAHVEDGDKRYIRKEYAEISELGKEEDK